MKRFLTLGAAALVLLAGGLSPAAAFPDKDITFIIPFSPGGGMDLTSRQVAKLLPKYLPKKVNVVPHNDGGAGGQKALGMLQQSKPDGHTVSVVNMPGAAIPELTGEKPPYNIKDFVWIGRMSTSTYVFVANPKSGIKTVADIKKLGRPLKVAGTGFGSSAYTASKVASVVMGFPVDMVTGYKSSTQYVMGTVRGDADAAMVPIETVAKFIQSGDLVGVVNFEQESRLKGVQTTAKAGYPELTDLGVERMVAAPPGTPKEIQKILSDAMAKAIADIDSQEWAKKTKREWSHLPADKTEAAVKRALAVFTKYPAALEK